MNREKIVRIGGGSAFFVDSALFVPQLIAADVDYVILDYLAEGSMGLFGRELKAGEGGGYPADFLDVHIGPHLAGIAEKGICIVANAGALDPVGLAEALRERIAELGLDLSVSAVSGDNLIERFAEIAPRIGMADIEPDRVTSLTAYLGAFPIAGALARGADIVVTGRAVDSALALGPLVHEFGWRDDDWDLLAAGTVAGHLIECGAQVTGGTFTDWRQVDGWETIGPPIAECRSDGSCTITKPSGSGGLVSLGTVAEQLLYEVSDPQAYHTPDLTCDFTTVQLEQAGEGRVRATGATGYPPTADYKICATWDDGWRATVYQPVIGPRARAKAEKQAAALFARGSAMLRRAQFADWRRTEAIPFGGEEEIVIKLVVEHDAMLPCQLFAREQLMAISGMAPGTSVGFGTQIQPIMRFAAAFLPKDEITPLLDGEAVDQVNYSGFSAEMIARPLVPTGGPAAGESRSLERLAFARSGEKGETINIGVIARKPDYLAPLRSALTEDALSAWLADLGDFDVQIYDVPGICAVNIVLDGALPGGINQSQRFDPAGKSIAQRLMPFPVPMPLGHL